MKQTNSLDFLQKKSESVDDRVKKAAEFHASGQLPTDALAKWISKSFSTDQNFRMSSSAWALLKTVLQDGQFKAERFSIYMKPTDLLPVYNSDFHAEAFLTIEELTTKYPNAWRPNYLNLMEFISLMIKSDKIHKSEVSLMMQILMAKTEIIASIKSVFDNYKLLFDPILEKISELDEEISFKLLSEVICVPSFVLKATEDSGKTSKEIVGNLSKFPASAALFAPYLMSNFVKQAVLLNKKLNLTFPLEIIEGCESLDVAAPVIRSCRELKMYQVRNDSKELPRLQNLAERSIKHGRTDVLIELTKIEFNSVRPFLESILPNESISTPPLFIAILQQCVSVKNPMIIFECGPFPGHILSSSDFVDAFVESIMHLTTNQLLLILEHLSKHTDRLEESCLLYWSVKFGHITAEFDHIIDHLLLNFAENPWVFAAATIAASKSQKRPPPPIDIVRDCTSHPVVLNCFLYEDYGTIEFAENTRFDQVFTEFSPVPEIPSPFMSRTDADVYRNAFIIRNLPQVAKSIPADKLVEILSFVVSNCVNASQMSPPKSVADYCLCLLYNSQFYESEEIKSSFTAAVLPLLPNPHLSSHEQSDIPDDVLYRCIVVASLPPEFLSPKVSTAAFVGLFLKFEQQQEMKLQKVALSSVFESFGKAATLVKCFCNVAENISRTFIKHNFDRIFAGCSSDAIAHLIPAVLDRLYNLQLEDSESSGNEFAFVFPQLSFSNPGQLISICDFCYEKNIKLPFSETLFESDIVAFCAQVRSEQPSAISLLLQKDVKASEAPMIVRALSEMKNMKELSSEFPPEFVKRLIDLLIESDTADASFYSGFLSDFCAKLDKDSILYFLSVANDVAVFYPHIFRSLNVKKDEFADFEFFVTRLLEEAVDDSSLVKMMCSIRLSHAYNSAVVGRLLLIITRQIINSDLRDLNKICTICQAVIQLLNNCNRELAKSPVNIVEVVRKVSLTFFKVIAKVKPSYKQIKLITKLYSGIAKVAYADQINYLIPSFVYNLTLYQVNNEEIPKMRFLQTAVFPLFTRCRKDQLDEVAAALHDSQREIFKKLSQRWADEYQYKGKV